MASKKQKRNTALTSFPALPRLKAGHGMQLPSGFEWTPNPQALQTVSRNIDVQNSAERGHSIPDIFSQSVQFAFDLSIGNADAVGQWQGLLATLLLAGSGGLVRVRDVQLAGLPDSPFVRIFRSVAARRGIDSITLFELRRADGDYSAVAFRHAGMATMLCPAAQAYGPFAVEDSWIVKTDRGYRFTAPYALRNDPCYEDRRLALRNEIHALSTRMVPPEESGDGLQLSCLRAFFQWLREGEEGIPSHPVNAQVRQRLYTVDPAHPAPPSEVFTDKICLLREGDAHNRLNAEAADSMRVFSGGKPTPWRALLPLRRAFAQREMDRLRAGTLSLRMQWHYGAVDAELLDERDQVVEARRFRAQDLVNFTRHRNAPQVAVWPPRAMADWRRYYLLRYDDGNALPLSMHVLGWGDALEEVTLLPEMPRGLAFAEGGVEVGVLLPAFETAVNSKTKEYNLGFDFGTTNTTAYKHDPAAGTTTPVSFADAGALLLFGREEGAGIALTAQLVADHIADRATHYTLLRRKGDTLSEGGVLLETTIPFLTGAGFNAEILRDVSDDLKWGMLTTDKLRANLFLEQYLMMCLWHVAAHGAAAVHWRASYPLSMQGRLQEDFIAKMQTITAGLCTHCYPIAHDIRFCSESEAVGFMMMDNDIQARYLQGRVVNDSTGFFCIDIGGGSTDLSLWLQRRPLMQASLRWAGNAILSDSITRENHGETHPPRESVLPYCFLPAAGEGKRAALMEPLRAGEFDAFRRNWNVLIEEATSAIKGVDRTGEPLLNYLNIVRFNLYMLFFFAGRMTGHAIAGGASVGMGQTPLPVAVLGNGARMMTLLYNDVQVVQTSAGQGGAPYIAQERRNETRYREEMDRLTRAFTEGCATPGFCASIIEPFMPKQETARGLAMAPEAFLYHSAEEQDAAAQGGWPEISAYETDARGVVGQAMTEGFASMFADTFDALRKVFSDDEAYLAFLSTLFETPQGAARYSLEAYYDSIWAQCLRHNPEPMLPGQPLPKKNTIAGRYVELLSTMNRMMKTV